MDHHEHNEGKHDEANQYADIDGDLILGDLDPEEPDASIPHAKPRQNQFLIRADVDDIVRGE